MYVFAKSSGGAAVVGVGDGQGGRPSFVLVGSSVPTSAFAGERVRQLTVYPEKGKGGMVAIACYDRNGAWDCAMVPIVWDADKLIVGEMGNGLLHNSFFSPNRIGHLYVPYRSDGREAPWIEVQIGDQRYTSNPDRVNGTTHLVTDTNLLCKYLTEDVDANAVAEAAIKSAADRTLSERLGAVQSLLATQNETLRRLAAECQRLQGMYEDRDRLVTEWGSLAKGLAKRLQRRWFLSEEDQKLLSDSRLTL